MFTLLIIEHGIKLSIFNCVNDIQCFVVVHTQCFVCINLSMYIKWYYYHYTKRHIMVFSCKSLLYREGCNFKS